MQTGDLLSNPLCSFTNVEILIGLSRLCIQQAISFQRTQQLTVEKCKKKITSLKDHTSCTLGRGPGRWSVVRWWSIRSWIFLLDDFRNFGHCLSCTITVAIGDCLSNLGCCRSSFYCGCRMLWFGNLLCRCARNSSSYRTRRHAPDFFGDFLVLSCIVRVRFRRLQIRELDTFLLSAGRRDRVKLEGYRRVQVSVV